MSRQLHRRALAHRVPGWWGPGLCAAPGKPATPWASCLCLRATSKEVSKGTSCWRGTRELRDPRGLFCPHSAPGSGVPGHGTSVGILGSWGEVAPPWAASFRDQAPVLRMEQGPLWPPQPSVPSLYALCGHGQWVMEPRKGEPRGHTPHLGESMTPVLSSGEGRRGSPSCPLHRAGLCKPLLVLSSHPHWAFLPPGANLGTLGACPGHSPGCLGQGPGSPQPYPRDQAHCQLCRAWHILGSGGTHSLGQGAFPWVAAGGPH